MSTTGPVFVVDYTDTPFEEVCSALAALEGTRLLTRRGGLAVAAVGALDHIGDHVARAALFAGDRVDEEPIAEVRVIAVSTGHDAWTEILVFAEIGSDSPAEHAIAVLRARLILASTMHWLAAATRPIAPRRAS